MYNHDTDIKQYIIRLEVIFRYKLYITALEPIHATQKAIGHISATSFRSVIDPQTDQLNG